MMTASDDQGQTAGGGEPSPTAANTPTRIPGYAWGSLVAIGLAALMSTLDSTIVSIANPAIAADLDASLGQISWVTNAYLLVLAGLLIPLGALSDKIGHKKAFLIGVAGFTIASLLCGISGSVEFLIFARVVQGVTGAFIFAAGLAALRHALPPDRLPLAFGIFGSVAAVAAAAGPVIGGLLVQYASWHWAFFINVPLGIVSVLVGVFALRETETLTKERLDLLGAVVLTLAMASVIWALNGASEHGWVSAQTLGFGIAGLVLLVVFILIERKVANPTVPLLLFTDRTFGIGVVLMITTMVAFFVLLFYLTFFLQSVRGDTPATAAVALLPLTIVLTVASPLAGTLAGKIGLRAIFLIGSAMSATGLFLLLRLEADSGWVTLLPSLILAGIGQGFLTLAATQSIVGSAPPEKAGSASGIQQSAQNLGSTLGISVFSSILATIVTSRFAPTLLGYATPDTEATLRELGATPDTTGQAALGFGPSAQTALSDQLTKSGIATDQVKELVNAVASAAHESFMDGLRTVFLITGIIVIAGGILALFIRPPKAAEADAPAT